jgi:predicted small lipoprotein YifL
VIAALLLASFAGCGDDDDGNNNDNQDRTTRPVAGTFVGTLEGSDRFVAVVATPPAEGQDRREVSAFVCDGDEVCAMYSAASSGNEVVAKSNDGEAQVELSGKSATGSVDLPEGESARYTAPQATATAGLYDLTVTRKGKVSGASAAGVGLTGSLELPPPGTGRIKLADGTRLRFEVTEGSVAESARLEAGQLRLIVLPDGQVRGAGKSRGEDGAEFLVVSGSK